jgi:hypothetical protein
MITRLLSLGKADLLIDFLFAVVIEKLPCVLIHQDLNCPRHSTCYCCNVEIRKLWPPVLGLLEFCDHPLSDVIKLSKERDADRDGKDSEQEKEELGLILLNYLPGRRGCQRFRLT